MADITGGSQVIDDAEVAIVPDLQTPAKYGLLVFFRGHKGDAPFSYSELSRAEP
jgi:hypothetical protein